MIRLTVNAQSEPKIHLFNKSLISIGSESSGADLCLLEESSQPIFLHIIEKNGFPIINNLTNDPYISLNGHPFGKKLLNHGDVILINDTEILFENVVSAQTISDSTPHSNDLPPISTTFDFPLPFENEVDILKDEEWHSSKIDELLAELEQTSPNPANPSKKQDRPTLHLKDDYLRDLDDETQQSQIKLKATPKKPSRWLAFFALSFLLATGIGSITAYVNVSKKTRAQELTAARSVADISMALTLARIDQLKPSNQNWSNIDFIKNNLKTLLPNSSSSAFDINAQGQFLNYPYSLRTYTNRDLSRFLILAQPAPSFLQWLIPKSVLLVDSEAMEVRAINDLKSLNRMLANPNPLEDANGLGITNLIKDSRLLTLSELALDGDLGFIPPATSTQGSENLIYNAPRYYLLSRSVLQKLNHLSSPLATSHEIVTFRQEMDALAQLPHIILYSPDGEKGAKKVKNDLNTFAPSNTQPVAYLNFDPKGEICDCHLIAENDEDDRNMNLIDNDNSSFISSAESSYGENGEQAFDINHPIFVQLTALSLTREKELKNESHKIESLLDRENHSPQPHFSTQLHELTMSYMKKDIQYNSLVKVQLRQLYEQHEELQMDEFLEMVKASGFESLIVDDKPMDRAPSESIPMNLVDAHANAEKLMQELFIEIERASTFSEMNRLTSNVLNHLNFDEFSYSETLADYQNQFRNRVIMRLEKLLLSATDHLETEDLNDNEEISFNHILNHEKIFHPHERSFFLDEWRLIRPQNNLQEPATESKESEFKDAEMNRFGSIFSFD